MKKANACWENVELLREASKKIMFVEALEVLGVVTGDHNRKYGGGNINKFKKLCELHGFDISHMNTTQNGLTEGTGRKIDCSKCCFVKTAEGTSRYKILENFIKIGEVAGVSVETAIANFCKDYSYPEHATDRLVVVEL